MALRLIKAGPFSFSRYSSRHQKGRNGSKKESRSLKEVAGMMLDNSYEWVENLRMMMELRKKLLTFRDTIDLPRPRSNDTDPINELVRGTIKDLHKLYPEVIHDTLVLKTQETSITKGLLHLYVALYSVSDLWAKHHIWITGIGNEDDKSLKYTDQQVLGRRVLAKLDHMITIARQISDVLDEDERNESRYEYSTFKGDVDEPNSDSRSICSSPETASKTDQGLVYPEPLVSPTRLQEVEEHGEEETIIEISTGQKAGEVVDIKDITITKLKEELAIPTLHAVSASPPPQENTSHNTNAAPRKSTTFTSNKPVPPQLPPLLSTKEVVTPSPPSLPPPKKETSAPPPSEPLSLTTEAAAPPPPMLLTKEAVAPPLPLPLSLTKEAVAPPSPPPAPPRKGVAAPHPQPLATNGVANPPPPPPFGAKRALGPIKARSKLKRSAQLASLYRCLKRMVEGQNGKQLEAKRLQVVAPTGGKCGMADALAEMTKRSSYFQKIEEDVQKHGKEIMTIRTALCSFHTKDMNELLRFHKYVEEHLSQLTDETQVLPRFEDFPSAKLESLRMAAALYTKLNDMITVLKNWRIEPPLGELLDKIESYFNKNKVELEALERNKDEESKRFQSQNIHFDFQILEKIKECMVDVSSGCMELALKERREARASCSGDSGSKTEPHSQESVKMLWRAFQFTFRVYTFAGGIDDRAEELTTQLAQEIQTDPQQLESHD